MRCLITFLCALKLWTNAKRTKCKALYLKVNCQTNRLIMYQSIKLLTHFCCYVYVYVKAMSSLVFIRKQLNVRKRTAVFFLSILALHEKLALCFLDIWKLRNQELSSFRRGGSALQPNTRTRVVLVQ